MTYRLALPGERYAYKRIKSDAAAARREFEIPFDWFAAACHMPCHYCGRTDGNTISVKSRSAKGGWVVKGFKYNGLDRKDNSLGYTIDNCVPCCTVCNRGKNSMGYNDWIEYLDTLVAFRLRDDEDDYQGRHVRSVSLPVSGGDREAGDEVTFEFTQSGYLSEAGIFQWGDADVRILSWPRMYGKSRLHQMYSQEEEPN